MADAIGISSTPGVETSGTTSSPMTTIEKDEIHVDRSSLAKQTAQTFNGYDPHLWEHAFLVDDITWVPEQIPGTVLRVYSMDPYLHPVLSYLSRLYQYWSGTITLKFRVFATGINAGSVAISTMPPTVDETAFRGMSWERKGYLPRISVDARTPGEFEVAFKDMNQQLIHRVGDGVVGSRVALWVFAKLQAQLINTAGVTIVCQSVVNKDFKFHYLFPQLDTPLFEGFHVYDQFLDFSMGQCATAGGDYDIIGLMANTTKKPIGTLKHCDVTGKLLYTTDTKGFPSTYVAVKNQAVGGQTYVTPGHIAVNSVMPVYSPAIMLDQTNHNGVATQPNYDAGELFYGARALAEGQTKVDAMGTADVYVDSAKLTGDGWVPFNDESIYYFGCGNSWEMLPAALKQACRRAPMNFGPGQALRYRVVNVATSDPIGYAKLYYNGFMTARGISENRLTPSVQLRFEFEEVIANNAQLPLNTYMALTSRSLDLENEELLKEQWGEDEYHYRKYFLTTKFDRACKKWGDTYAFKSRMEPTIIEVAPASNQDDVRK